MTLRQLLEDTRLSLASHGVDEATLEADLMLMKALDVDRPRLYASPERVTTPEEREVVSRDVARRLSRRSLAVHQRASGVLRDGYGGWPRRLHPSS